MIAHFAAFHANYGDLLYHPLLAGVLAKLGMHNQMQPVAILGGAAPLEAGYQVAAAREILASHSPTLSTVIIGGGAVLKPYSETMINNFLAPEHAIPDPSLSKGTRWISRLFRKNKWSATASSWLTYPNVAPYILDPDHFSKRPRVAYCSCGAGAAFPALPKAEAATAFDRASFIYVRDEWTASAIRQLGVDREIHVAPDLAVLASDLYPHDERRQYGRSLFEQYGLKRDRPVFVVQSAPSDDSQRSQDFVKLLQELRDRHDANIVLLPIGYCHSDHEYLSTIAATTGFLLLAKPHVLSILSIIAAADAFIGTSMHGCVTAFSYGIPFVIGPTVHAKQAGFLSACNLDPTLEVGKWSDGMCALERSRELGNAYFASRLERARERIYQVMRMMLPALQGA